MSSLNKSREFLMKIHTLNRNASVNYSKLASKANEDNDRPIFLDADNQPEIRTVKRNKSGLLSQDRKKLHGKVPYNEPHSWIHLREKYQRKMYALYGNASGVDPRICFPTMEDLRQQSEYANYAEPYTLSEMMQKVRLENQQRKNEILKREEDIAKKLEKLDQWKNDLNAKIAKKEAETIAAKERKERLIEEVRRHFGFKVDPRDERFKEMLEQKEKEDKKKQKEAKRKAKEDKMMAKMIEKNVPGDK